MALPTYLRGFETSAYAQTSAPVKMGFIEDEIRQSLSVWHPGAARSLPAVAEINDGKTLKGSPDIGAGFLGAEATAKNPPVISKDGTSLAVVDDAGAQVAGRSRLRGGRRHFG